MIKPDFINVQSLTLFPIFFFLIGDSFRRHPEVRGRDRATSRSSRSREEGDGGGGRPNCQKQARPAGLAEGEGEKGQ